MLPLFSLLFIYLFMVELGFEPRVFLHLSYAASPSYFYQLQIDSTHFTPRIYHVPIVICITPLI
jgi:hypothetical protein